MILKKPYAFLIKRFRLIHLLLTLLIGYLFIRTYEIFGYFSRYVSNTVATRNDADPSSYVTIIMFLGVIIVIAFSSAMYLLMKKKDKPKTLYIFMSGYYLLLFASYIFYFVVFKGTATKAISLQEALVYRDITLILFLPQIAFLVLAFIRGIGFDIKKFNFSKDLKELELSEEDNEEFEFVLGLDSYKYARFLRRRIREFKYYILENKLMFMILSSLVGLIVVILIVLNFTVYNKTYRKNERFVANNLTVQINNSYLTNMDYKGNIIEKDKYFLVINTTFINNSGLSTVLNLTSYELKTKTGNVYPTLQRNNYFIDLGQGYAKEKIESGKETNYIFVYELNKKQVANSYTLRIIDEVKYNAGTMNSKTKNVSIKPKKYTELDTVGAYQLKTPVTMYESILEDSSLLVNSYDFMNKYTYKYQACIRNNCSDKLDAIVADATKDKTLLVLSGSLVLDNDSTFAKNIKTGLSFFDAFVQLKYDDNISPVINATTSALTEKYVLQVDSSAPKAKKLDLLITVRDKKYIINLK